MAMRSRAMLKTYRRITALPGRSPWAHRSAVTSRRGAPAARPARPAYGAPGDRSGDDDGFETFRRAVCEGDGAAWEVLIGRYRRLVLSWIQQHPLGSTVTETDCYWVTCAFERFWLAVTPERLPQFATLRALLGYLKLCALSVLLDDVRARRAACLAPFDAGDGAGYRGVGDAQDEAERLVARHDLWSAVWRALPDPTERLVVYLSFARGYQPREIRAHHPARFATVAAVYRVKAAALDRLRRSAALRHLV
jgi:hypothetical protein